TSTEALPAADRGPASLSDLLALGARPGAGLLEGLTRDVINTFLLVGRCYGAVAPIVCHASGSSLRPRSSSSPVIPPLCGSPDDGRYAVIPVCLSAPSPVITTSFLVPHRVDGTSLV